MSAPRGWLAATALAALGVYLLMWVGYASQWEWLADFDAALLDPLHRVGASHPGWVQGWDVFCTVLGPFAFRLATLVLIVGAFLRRNTRVAIFLIITVELSGLVTEIAKRLADRPRPAGALVSAYGTSFPSGHALGVLISVLALLVVAVPVLRPRWRGAIVGFGLVVIVAIGVARVVLNVHHPSDVIAGWALGYAYFAGCLLVAPPRRVITRPDEIPVVPDTAR